MMNTIKTVLLALLVTVTLCSKLPIESQILSLVQQVQFQTLPETEKVEILSIMMSEIAGDDSAANYEMCMDILDTLEASFNESLTISCEQLFLPLTKRWLQRRNYGLEEFCEDFPHLRVCQDEDDDDSGSSSGSTSSGSSRSTSSSSFPIIIIVCCLVGAVFLTPAIVGGIFVLIKLCKSKPKKKKVHFSLSQNVPVINIEEVDDAFEQENCAICLQSLKSESVHRMINNCKHIFHDACIVEFIKNAIRTRREQACPVCKSNIEVRTEADQEVETHEAVNQV